MTTLKLGTRGSQLALFQANTTAALLKAHAGIDCEIVIIKTSGDRLAEAPLSEIGGKRLFVKELEDSLLAGDIDLAVHSSKDLPAVLPPGLTIGAVLPREDPRDAVVLPGGRLASTLPEVEAILGDAPRIGTSSVPPDRAAHTSVCRCPFRSNSGESRYSATQARRGRL
jgi:hydroxymethylbilane synthase